MTRLRAITEIVDQEFIIISLQKVNKVGTGAVKILREFLQNFEDTAAKSYSLIYKMVVLINAMSLSFKKFAGRGNLHFPNLDQAIEWVEDN